MAQPRGISTAPHAAPRAHHEVADDELEEPLRSVSARSERPGAYSAVFQRTLQPFIASWPILLLGLVIGAAIAGWSQSNAPIVYTAEALVAPNRSRTQVQFVPQIKTVDDSSTQAQAGITPERRQALVDLVRSSGVEDQVIGQLSGKLPADELQRGQIIQHISGAIRPRSEILSIQATAASSADAIAIANSWANNYVDQVNRIYSTGSDHNSVITLRDQAQQNLRDAETALSNSISNSPLESLDRQIADQEALLALLQSPPQASSTSSSSTNSNGGTDNKSTNSGSSVNPQNDYRLAARRTLDDLAQTLRRIDVTRENVRALLAQARAVGGLSSSDTAALTLLKTQLVAISDGMPAQLQLQLPAATSPGSVDELQALAENLDQVRGQIASDFEARRTQYEQDTAQQIAAIEQKLQDLRAQRETANAERTRLTAQRDLASDTYSALAKKADEVQVSDSSASREVELASEATFASELPRRSFSGIAQAAALGLVVAALIALVRWFGFGRQQSINWVGLLPTGLNRKRPGAAV